MRRKQRRMNEQEMTQQEPEVVETPAEEAAQEAEVIDVAALTAAAAKADEYLALAQRTQADFDNFRRRNESVRADAFAEGQRAVAKAMLAVLDNLERGAALENADEGVKLILKQFREILTKYHVESCAEEGQTFDPNFHNAVMHVEDDTLGEGVVAEVLQKGYCKGERVLRYAMVKVAN